MIDYKNFTKLFYFIFCHNKLQKNTRYVLMGLMEYQNIFKLEENFELHPLSFERMFDVEPSQLEYVLSYLKYRRWVESEKTENGYLITINYKNLEEYRNKILKK